jgi:DNA polymerase I
VQIQKVFEILDAFGIKQIQVDGYEADDIIGTLSTKFSEKVDVIISSNDRDLWQLTSDNVFLLVPGKSGDLEWLGRKEVISRLGFDPEKVPDYKGLRGDPSDNIPGVFGIGEVTATKLIKEFGSLEEIYKNIQKVQPEALREKLLNCYEQALMSKKLAQIICDVPLRVELNDCKYSDFNRTNVRDILQKYNFKSLIKRLGFSTEGKPGKTARVDSSADQLSLF